jgi:acyl-CoA dehydrogenase
MVSEIVEWRRRWITKPVLSWYRKVLPPISPTERDAIAAGTVWWDGELFSGNPDWEKLRSSVRPELTAEEQAFLDGPMEKLCRMLNDWEIRRQGDLPEEIWNFIRKAASSE